MSWGPGQGKRRKSSLGGDNAVALLHPPLLPAPLLIEAVPGLLGPHDTAERGPSSISGWSVARDHRAYTLKDRDVVVSCFHPELHLPLQAPAASPQEGPFHIPVHRRLQEGHPIGLPLEQQCPAQPLEIRSFFPLLYIAPY